MLISALSGNEIFCLALKGLSPGEITVGNSVRSLGVGGSIGSRFQSLAGGEVGSITAMISEGRHAAIARMEQEAQRHGAAGIVGVTTELKTLASYTEFLAQGTGVHVGQTSQNPFFSAAVSGTELYCHLDAGYVPHKFVMGNVAYALGIGRGLTGGLRTLARGEVKEYSDLYNG
ncbi:MAG: heavy metal-binding domain-containing protein, partial [Polyangiaceae bacterium]